MGNYVKKLGVTCEDCLRYEHCELILTKAENDLKTELEEFKQTSLLDFITKERVKREKEKTITEKIIACLNKRAYVAVVKKYRCFKDQEYWEGEGIVSNCKKCHHYFPEYNICVCGLEPRNKRGFCSAYAYDIGKEDWEEFYELESM